MGLSALKPMMAGMVLHSGWRKYKAGWQQLFKSSMAEGVRKLDGNMNKHKGYSWQSRQPNHDNPSVTLAGNNLTWFSLKCGWKELQAQCCLCCKCHQEKSQDGNKASQMVNGCKSTKNTPKKHILYSCWLLTGPWSRMHQKTQKILILCLNIGYCFLLLV